MASKIAAVTPSRLASLTRLRCSIFQTAYNPTNIRTGAKYLRARLRGPSMIKYYPPESELDIARIMRKNPKLELVNTAEEVRLADLADRKKRGKAPPKKAKNRGESRRAHRKR